MTNAIAEEKAALRKQVLALRAAIPAAKRARKSALICDELIAAHLVAPGMSVAVFSPFEDEVHIGAFVEEARTHEAHICYPCMMRNPGHPQTHPKSHMVFRAVPAEEDGVIETTASTAPFIAKPLRSFEESDTALGAFPLQAPETIDLVIAPLVAFDNNNRRLGYGGGNYDRLLPLLRDDARIVGVAFAEQKVAAVPQDVYDVPLERIFFA